MGRSSRSEILPTVLDAFRFDGAWRSTEAVVGGHIHRNFLITCAGDRYLLQEVNARVFPEVHILLSNGERVGRHLRQRGRRSPTLVETTIGASSFVSADGSVWRAWHYLEGTSTLSTAPDGAKVYQTARAFSDFVDAMTGFPGPPLRPTIERFHDLRHRVDELDAAAAADHAGRRSRVRGELDHARHLGMLLSDAVNEAEGTLSVRLVHNDAKLSNVRFDDDPHTTPVVLDLDTTMGGRIRWDVGELMRTTCTRTPEDADLAADVGYDLEFVDALATGYFSTDVMLDPSELVDLALGGPEMAVENAVRFLTDYLAGDRYFATDRPQQNLDRCRAQLRLSEVMLDSHSDAASSFARADRARKRRRRPGAETPMAPIPAGS